MDACEQVWLAIRIGFFAVLVVAAAFSVGSVAYYAGKAQGHSEAEKLQEEEEKENT